MWAEKDRMKVGEVIRHSPSGEIAIVIGISNFGIFTAKSVMNTPNNFCKTFSIDSDEFWDVLE